MRPSSSCARIQGTHHPQPIRPHRHMKVNLRRRNIFIGPDLLFNFPCSISRSNCKGPSNYGDFHFQAVRWLALPPVGSGLKWNLFAVRPLFRLTPAPPRRLWLIRTLSQSPSPTKARTIRSPPILCRCRCRARGSRASRALTGEDGLKYIENLLLAATGKA